ncbi:uncharacterized protein F4822DRAFT_115145 [Hypoxylon trugodes]|uniref:uncharacterized protein n=1 Tax=Hypoxylon trugodes TaxID=326681 RepID=UPI00219A6B19|nr:uncharacterized protein F4822DRAFT_115145 [Hypoxylon trugodes]KAI1392085.1 hypothetical protein F4822DRAFT_115145 [Hypoxylon trugodes]
MQIVVTIGTKWLYWVVYLICGFYRHGLGGKNSFISIAWKFSFLFIYNGSVLYNWSCPFLFILDAPPFFQPI